jgi:hypothetical protein
VIFILVPESQSSTTYLQRICERDQGSAAGTENRVASNLFRSQWKSHDDASSGNHAGYHNEELRGSAPLLAE